MSVKLAQGVAAVVAACTVAGCDLRPHTELGPVEVRHFRDGRYERLHTRDGLAEGRVLSYSPTGRLEAIHYFHRDTMQGPVYRFYPNGKLFVREEARGGVLNGFSCGFFPSGRVMFTRYMAGGLRVGPYRRYYDRPAPRLREAIDFLNVGGKEYPNHYEAYDSLGHLRKRTGWLQARAERDTLAVGDTLVLHLRVRYPEYGAVRVTIGKYDAQFVLRDSASQQALPPSRGPAATVYGLATERGPEVLRGYVENFGTGARRRDGTTVEQGQRLYFAYPYFVR